MLFSNHLVNIAYIHEEGTAMAQIRIPVLHCGKIGVAPNLPASAQWRWPAKADARRLKSGARIWLPVSAYLVEHPKGLFLVDAGLPRTVSPTGIEDRAAQLRMFGRGWYTLVHSVVEPGQSIGEQLAARGIRPQDLDYVLFSHLDPDHVAGISEVRGAKRLLVAEEEYFWSCRVNLRYDRADMTSQAVSAETAQACLDVLKRLQAAGCDALGLGRKAIWSAWSMSDWRDSDFPARLQNLRWTVEVRSEPAA